MRRVSCVSPLLHHAVLSPWLRCFFCARNRRNCVEGRTRLAIGGVATFAASVAVVCAVAMTTSVALADSAGAPAGARSVIVPAAAAMPSVVPTPTTSALRPAARTYADLPETVPAPAPEDVASPVGAHPSVGEPSAASEDQLIAQIEQSGSLDAAYAWAQQQGWQPARVDAWITRREADVAEKGAKDAPESHLGSDESTAGNRIASPPPAETGTTSGRDLSGSSSGTKREQSRVPPG